jgi:SNF2 family DNA or RNA helicase
MGLDEMESRPKLRLEGGLLFSDSAGSSHAPRFSELSDFVLPDDIGMSALTPPADLLLAIRGAEIRDGRPYIQCEVRCTGRYSEVEPPSLLSIGTDVFVHNDKVIRINRPSFEGMSLLLGGAGVTDLSMVTLRQYIDIVRSDSDALVDYSTLQNINLESLKDLLGPVESSLFEGTPYDFQMDGIRWMWMLCREELGLILGDEMGLGKTFQIIFLFCLFKERQDSPNLVVCPATLVSNWSREIEKFAPDLNVYEHKGPLRTGSSEFLREHDVVITSYDTMIASEGEMRLIFEKIDWALVVLDEAQAIKNPEAKRSGYVKRLSCAAGIAVTGTPLENRITDVWSLFDFCLPGFLGDLEGFEERYPNDIASATRLEGAITPFILRRLIGEVKDDLPERIDVEHSIQMSEREEEAYLGFIHTITDGRGKDSLGLGHLQQLRVYCTHPDLVEGIEIDLMDHSKFARLIELLSEVRQRRQKAVIFTSFTGMIDRICEFLPSYFDNPDPALRPQVDFIDGRNSRDALDIIDRFGSKEGFAILALNPRAAGVGLTITAANHVFHYNPEWNPALMAQATARVHRIGQENEVVAHWMYCTGKTIDTIEEKMMDKLGFKRQLFEGAIRGIQADSEDEESFIRSLLNLEEEG